MQIRSFRHKGLKRLWESGVKHGLPARLVSKLEAILHAIDEAKRIEEIGLFPGWRLHPLKGDRTGEWSVSVTGNFRLTFGLDGEVVTNVDLEDYH